MSFKNLNKKQLLKAAKLFDVEVAEDDTNPQIVAALEEANASWTNYKKFVAEESGVVADDVADEDESEDQVEFGKPVLLKMERKNPTYDILGHRFTKDQPFQVMSEDEAQKVIDTAELEGGGFRVASPAEARSYFG